MPLLRRDHGAGQTNYRMREKMFSIGEDFWIENEAGERAFKVDGKALRVRDTLILQDPSGNELFKVQKKELHVRDTMEIERDGDTSRRSRRRSSMSCGTDSSRSRPARTSRRRGISSTTSTRSSATVTTLLRSPALVPRSGYLWRRIAPGEDDALILAVVVCIDQMSHD